MELLIFSSCIVTSFVANFAGTKEIFKLDGQNMKQFIDLSSEYEMREIYFIVGVSICPVESVIFKLFQYYFTLDNNKLVKIQHKICLMMMTVNFLVQFNSMVNPIL